jgi:hypothetical protein
MDKWKFFAALACGACLGTWVTDGLTTWTKHPPAVVSAKEPSLTALDYQEIIQLTNRYAYGIDTCSNDGYDYADVFTPDGMFIDRNTDEGVKQGGRVLAKGREALATLIGGGSRGCKTKMIWTGWSHIMANQVILPSADGATGRIYLLQMGIKGPGSIERHGGYEDVYVKTAMGWRIKSRTHIREEAWLNPLLREPSPN